jgi:hypothetical protein
MPDDSVDACVTDPPYGLGKPPDPVEVLQAWMAGKDADVSGGGFMGRKWDAFVPGPTVWREVLRVLKPGGHIVCFAGTRTLDWMGMALRLAGFEVRDCGQWCYWSGFPKSLNVSKAMDAAAGAALGGGWQDEPWETAAATPLARQWSGWGTAIKPAVEPWLLARKPLEGTVAANVERWGTGALNIDACRFAPGDPMWPGPSEGAPFKWENGRGMGYHGARDNGPCAAIASDAGRFPANLVYCPKASRAEREAGCEGLPAIAGHEAVGRAEGSAGLTPRAGAGRSSTRPIRNHHPTVKPLRLMRWLVRLVTPPGGVVLDPFMGSGTTGMAAAGQGFDFVGCELEVPHLRIARARIAYAATGRDIEAPDEATDGVEPLRQVGLFGGAACDPS